MKTVKTILIIVIWIAAFVLICLCMYCLSHMATIFPNMERAGLIELMLMSLIFLSIIGSIIGASVLTAIITDNFY